MAEGDLASGVPGQPVDRLLRSMPWLPGLCAGLVPLGLLGIYGWHRLGQGRLHAFEYWCVLLMVLAALGAAFGLFAAIGLRGRRAGRQRPWAERSAGLAFSCAALLALYLAAQLVCWRLNTQAAARIVRQGVHSTGASYQASHILGHMPKMNVTADAQLHVDGDLIFDYTYHTDARRRRITPDTAPGRPDGKSIVFFGDSFTFGEGVNDNETLPNQVARLRADWTVYNYAFSGYGPNHMLARLESLDTRSEVEGRTFIGVYVMIPDHVRRVVGAMSVIGWSRHSPYYRFTEDGQIRRSGSFQTDRPGVTRLYDLLKGDHVLQYFKVNLPPTFRDRDIALTTAVIAAAEARWKAQFDGAPFYVVLYPRVRGDEFDATRLLPWLRARGLTVLDYTELLDGPPETWFYLPVDRHPRAAAHAVVAARLVADVFADEGQDTP